MKKRQFGNKNWKIIENCFFISVYFAAVATVVLIPLYVLVSFMRPRFLISGGVAMLACLPPLSRRRAPNYPQHPEASAQLRLLAF